MVMPGDNVKMMVELITPIAMDEGLRFAIREGGRTVGAGVVAKIIAVGRSHARPDFVRSAISASDATTRAAKNKKKTTEKLSLPEILPRVPHRTRCTRRARSELRAAGPSPRGSGQ